MTGQLTSGEHASLIYREALISLKKFYQAEREYDAITDEYLNRLKRDYAVTNMAVDAAAMTLAKQRAARDQRQVEAGKRAAYFRERAAMLTGMYLMERDWQNRTDIPLNTARENKRVRDTLTGD